MDVKFNEIISDITSTVTGGISNAFGVKKTIDEGLQTANRALDVLVIGIGVFLLWQMSKR